MKSRISFFNPALYKKDIIRFAPLWILYTVAMLLIMLSVIGGTPVYNKLDWAMYRVEDVANTIGGLSVMNLLYGMMAAQLLFGELFNARLCNALHAMPVSREARFGSHLMAGLSFSIVPNLLVSVLMMPNLQVWWYAPLLWYLAMTLQYLFFFGVAILAIQCTGNRFAAALVYAIINFVSMAALWFAGVVFVPLMKGVVLDWESFALFSPVVAMCSFSELFSVNAAENMYYFEWGEHWHLLVIYAAVGIVATVGALLIYRRRALECAGDFMAVKVLGPIFLVIYTLCVGAVFAVFGSIFGGDPYVTFMIVGFAVGFFTGRMLLERSIRVFNRKSFLHLVLLVALIWLALHAVQGDWFGIVRYVPDPDFVKEAEVQSYYYGKNRIKTSDPEHLKLLQEAHRLAIEEEGCMHHERRNYTITYRMKDGRTVKREYSLCTYELASAKFDRLLTAPTVVLDMGERTWEEYIKSVRAVIVDRPAGIKYLTEAEYEPFLASIYKDCEEGLFGSEGIGISSYSVNIELDHGNVHLQIRENTAAYEWLKAQEKQELEKFKREVLTMNLNGHEIDKKYFSEILDAMYMDWSTYGSDCFVSSTDTPYVLNIDTGYIFGNKDYWITEYAKDTYEWIKDYLYEAGEFE